MFHLALHCLIGHSTTTQTTGECRKCSVTDTVALRLLCWDRDPNACSLASLHAPQVRALTTYARATLDKQSCVITSTLFEMNSTCMLFCDLNFRCLSTSITSPRFPVVKTKNVSKSSMADLVYISCLQTLIL